MKGRVHIVLLAAALLLLTGSCATPSALFMQAVENGYRSGMYSQDRLQFVDPVGDAFLLRKLDTIPVKLWSYLIHASLPQAEGRKQSPPATSFKIGKALPIDTDRLLNECAIIMRGYFPEIIPSACDEHKWSPDASAYLRYGYWHRLRRRMSKAQQDCPAPTLGMTKLLICLSCGWTSRYCVTGQEDALSQWIMLHPDRSVEPHELFSESYRLNNGNIYLTLLTCENILTKMPFRPDRDKDPMQRKLVYIRDDSEPLGDNYGAWYHFFGAALYGFVRSQSLSTFVVDVESFGSFFYEGPDRQESLLNRCGAIFGSQLRTMFESAAWCLVPSDARTDYLLPGLAAVRK